MYFPVNKFINFSIFAIAFSSFSGILVAESKVFPNWLTLITEEFLEREFSYSVTRSRTVPGHNLSRKLGRYNGDATAKVFRAVWNLPNSCGDKYGIELPLGDFGIEFNSNHEWTSGNVINIFYSGELGLYPYYENYNKSIPVNGGLPQLANITQHLEKATADILTAIPNPHFDGVGVLDWEAWRPQWEFNWDKLAVYRDESIAHVRQRHPNWDNNTVESVAKLEWTEAAKLYMESTLNLVKTLRPNATWGYYAYPYCFLNKANMLCKESGLETNDEIMWLFNQSTALYPSIYLRPTYANQRAYVKSHLQEAFRLRERSSDPQGVVMAYTRINYTNTVFYYNLADLNNTILQSAELGTHGVVIWGDNFDNLGAEVCMHLQSYIRSALGPTVLMAQNGAESCSQRVCSGKGHCVGDILACGGARRGQGSRSWGRDGGDKIPGGNVCTCRCFRGWTGDDCSNSQM